MHPQRVKKHQEKIGLTILLSSQKDNKRISVLSDHFIQRGWGEFQDQHHFSREELLQSLLKPIGLQKGPLLPLFKKVKITATFDLTMIYAVGAI